MTKISAQETLQRSSWKHLNFNKFKKATSKDVAFLFNIFLPHHSPPLEECQPKADGVAIKKS
jgi:hypothetical protein